MEEEPRSEIGTPDGSLQDPSGHKQGNQGLDYHCGQEGLGTENEEGAQMMLECQVLNTNHFAVECSGRDTCGTCRGEHYMAKCLADDHE